MRVRDLRVGWNGGGLRGRCNEGLWGGALEGCDDELRITKFPHESIGKGSLGIDDGSPMNLSTTFPPQTISSSRGFFRRVVACSFSPSPRAPGTDGAGPPPPPLRMPAVVRMPCLSWPKVQGREALRRRHRLTEPTTKALCQTSPPARENNALARTTGGAGAGVPLCTPRPFPFDVPMPRPCTHPRARPQNVMAVAPATA